MTDFPASAILVGVTRIGMVFIELELAGSTDKVTVYLTPEDATGVGEKLREEIGLAHKIRAAPNSGQWSRA